MTHHLYGLFADKTHACRAYHELLEREGGGECSVLVHEHTVNDADVPFDQTHAGRGALAGAAIVGVAGAVIGGLVAGPASLLGLGPLAAAVFAGGVGSVYGALTGALAGLSETDADDFEDALHHGRVLVAAYPSNGDDDDEIASILERHGGRVVDHA
jgi:hypothetical protein